MATNFPGSIDSLPDPTSSSPMNNPSHSGQHANANDAIVAIEETIGTSGAPNFAKLAATPGGDVAGAGSTYAAPLLNAVGVAGTYGSSSLVPTITTDAKGRVTAVTPTAIQITESEVTNLTSDLASKLPLTSFGAAGKNAVINGGMDIWQRGTSFPLPAATNTYTADRWCASCATTNEINISQVASGLTGYQYALRTQRVSAATSVSAVYVAQSIETNNSLLYAGQTVTFSFYLRTGANFSGTIIDCAILTGTGTDQNIINGFTSVAVPIELTPSPGVSSPWTRYTSTATIASTATQVAVRFYYTPTGTAGTADYFDITGVQLELGTVATPFSRAGGSIGGELALCQRYYMKFGTSTAYEVYGNGYSANTTIIFVAMQMPVPMRATPSFTSSAASTFSTSSGTPTGVGIYAHVNNVIQQLQITVSSTTSGGGANLQDSGGGTSYLAFSAEL